MLRCDYENDISDETIRTNKQNHKIDFSQAQFHEESAKLATNKMRSRVTEGMFLEDKTGTNLTKTQNSRYVNFNYALYLFGVIYFIYVIIIIYTHTHTNYIDTLYV